MAFPAAVDLSHSPTEPPKLNPKHMTDNEILDVCASNVKVLNNLLRAYGSNASMSPLGITQVTHGGCPDGTTASILLNSPSLSPFNVRGLCLHSHSRPGGIENTVRSFDAKKLCVPIVFTDVCPSLELYAELVGAGHAVFILDHHASGKKSIVSIVREFPQYIDNIWFVPNTLCGAALTYVALRAICVPTPTDPRETDRWVQETMARAPLFIRLVDAADRFDFLRYGEDLFMKTWCLTCANIDNFEKYMAFSEERLEAELEKLDYIRANQAGDVERVVCGMEKAILSRNLIGLMPPENQEQFKNMVVGLVNVPGFFGPRISYYMYNLTRRLNEAELTRNQRKVRKAMDQVHAFAYWHKSNGVFSISWRRTSESINLTHLSVGIRVAVNNHVASCAKKDGKERESGKCEGKVGGKNPEARVMGGGGHPAAAGNAILKRVSTSKVFGHVYVDPTFTLFQMFEDVPRGMDIGPEHTSP